MDKKTRMGITDVSESINPICSDIENYWNANGISTKCPAVTEVKASVVKL